MFGKLQSATATSIGIDPVVTVAANASGGVVGKMISPQSIAVASAAGNLVGRESGLFRFTVKHSFIMLMLICLIVLGQAYVFSSIIPHYQFNSAKAVATNPDLSTGYVFLLILTIVIIAFATVVSVLNRHKVRKV